MILIQQSYSSPDPRRDAELTRVRALNAASAAFDHIELVDPGDRRLSFADLFGIAASRFPGKTCVVANSDIAFDGSIRGGESILRGGTAGPTMLAISRWDDDTAPSMEGRVDPADWTFYSHSQDAWVFVAGALPAFEAGFLLGMPACENRLAYEAAAAGVSIANPALSIRLHHHHASAVRSWRDRDAYRGPMLFPRLTTADTGDRRALVVDRSGWRTRKRVVSLVGEFAATVRGSGRRGFSLVELLVVIAILGVLLSLLLPAVQRAREAGRRTACSANLHAMGLALGAYESARRTFPPGSDAVTRRDHAWSSFILPFLDGETVSRRIDYTQPWNAAGGNAEIADLVISTYVCPSGIRMFPGKQDYGGVLGTGITIRDDEPLRAGWDHSGVLYATDAAHPRPVRAAMVTDGLANTILVSEGVDRGFEDMDGDSRIGNARWACGTNCFLQNSRVVNTPEVDGFRGNHVGGVHGLFADGHVTFLGDETPGEVLIAISTKDWGDGGAPR